MSRTLMVAIFCQFAVAGCLLAVSYDVVRPTWPSCGPRFTISEELYRGRTVYWLRRRAWDRWPVCWYPLDSPSMFGDVESARAAAIQRLEDRGERVVATVP